MKMSDWFKSEIRLHGDIIECDDFAYAEMSCEYIVNDIDAGVAICHAVNSHDKLAEENADLREGLKLMIEQFKSEHNCEYEYKIIKWNEDLLNK